MAWVGSHSLPTMLIFPPFYDILSCFIFRVEKTMSDSEFCAWAFGFWKRVAVGEINRVNFIKFFNLSFGYYLQLNFKFYNSYNISSKADGNCLVIL